MSVRSRAAIKTGGRMDGRQIDKYEGKRREGGNQLRLGFLI